MNPKVNLTRKEAKCLGLKTYTAGKPCKKGHDEGRLTSNGGCVVCCRKQTSRWIKENPDYAREKLQDWRKRNRDKYNSWSKKWRSRPTSKASILIRNCIRRAYLSGVKGQKGFSSKDVGYEPIDLIKHIESLWDEGMSWNNYGDWHIDHIKPISAFVKEGISDPSIVNSLDNLQPLWAKDNLSKKDSYD